MIKIEKLQQWLLYTPLGQYVLKSERAFYHNIAHNIFGSYALQIGLAQINLLHNNMIPNRYVVGSDMKCNLLLLPFASNSIDLIICPHSLEFSTNYLQILKECYRILNPNGKLLITCFNHNSLFKLLTHKHDLMKHAHLIKLPTLKHQLNNIGFSIDGGRFFSYCPPINNTRLLAKLAWMDKIGDRWLPTLANNFALSASKQLVTPTMIPDKKSIYSKNINEQLGIATTCKITK